MKLPAQIQIIIAFRIVDIEEKQIWKGGNPYICCGVKQCNPIHSTFMKIDFSLHVWSSA
jgi:hypothetical protein